METYATLHLGKNFFGISLHPKKKGIIIYSEVSHLNSRRVI